MTQMGLALFVQDVMRRTGEPQEGSQEYDILKALRAGDKLTQLEAKERFGTLRLGARIFDLKKLGHPIECEMIPVPGRHRRTRVAQYYLPK